MILPKKALKNYRRYRGYDYSRGATFFITISTEPRQAIFGRVFDDRIELNAFGLAAEETFRLEEQRNPALHVMAFVIMPDHVHFMIHVRAGEKEPLRQIGQFVANFKRWTKYKVEKLGAVGFGWQANYHDWICSTREGMDAVAKYIKNNPLKWSLMHGANPPLKVIEPLAHDRLPVGEWWSGVGQMALLEGKIAAIRLSRRIPARDYPAVVARLMGACEKGYTLASTFISPCERAVLQELIRREIPFVKMVPDALSMIYRPKEDEPLLFAKGLYLLLSRVAPEGESRYDAWHGINAALAKIAEWNGVSLYVEPAGWRFSPSQGRRSQDSAEPAGGRGSAEPAGGAACGRGSAEPAGGAVAGRGSAEPAGGFVLNGGA